MPAAAENNPGPFYSRVFSTGRKPDAVLARQGWAGKKVVFANIWQVFPHFASVPWVFCLEERRGSR